jgi:hypothetical protein
MCFRHACLAAAIAVVVGRTTAQPALQNVAPQALAALTPVTLVIDDTISSNTNHNGDRFALHVANDVKAGDAVLIPAGSAGEGEVVHAARSRGGGKAGELILVARFVMVGDKKVLLRSFEAGSGTDHSPAAIATAILAGPAAFLVKGGAFVIQAGSVATAKTTEEILLPPTRAASAHVAESNDQSTTTAPTEEPRQ